MTHPDKNTQDTPVVNFGLSDLLMLLTYVSHSVRSHRLLTAGCFLGTVGLTVVILIMMPRTYQIDTRILTNSAQVITGIATSGWNENTSVTSAIRSANEILRSRELMLKLIDKTNLIKQWKETRTPIGRVMDKIRAIVLEPLNDEILRDALVEVLKRSIWASVEDNVIVISVTWHDAQTTLDIVSVAQQLFLDEMRSRQLNEHHEKIKILERKLSESQKTLDRLIEEHEKELKDKLAKEQVVEEPEQQVTEITRVKTSKKADDKEIEKLEQTLSLKKQEIVRLERRHEQRLIEARGKVEELQTKLGPQHPELISATRYLELLNKQPAVPASLYAQAREIDAELKKIGAGSDRGSRTFRIGSSRKPLSADIAPGKRTALDKLEEEISFQAYRQQEMTHNNLSELLGNARLQLEAASAAFNYSYRITEPPLLPKKPIKPSPPKFIMVAIFVGLFLGIVIAVIANLRSAMVYESWQIERQLGIHVFGELDDP